MSLTLDRILDFNNIHKTFNCLWDKSTEREAFGNKKDVSKEIMFDALVSCDPIKVSTFFCPNSMTSQREDLKDGIEKRVSICWGNQQKVKLSKIICNLMLAKLPGEDDELLKFKKLLEQHDFEDLTHYAKSDQYSITVRITKHQFTMNLKPQSVKSTQMAQISIEQLSSKENVPPNEINLSSPKAKDCSRPRHFSDDCKVNSLVINAAG